MTKYLGIDTGTNSLGWAIVEKGLSRKSVGISVEHCDSEKEEFFMAQ